MQAFATDRSCTLPLERPSPPPDPKASSPRATTLWPSNSPPAAKNATPLHHKAWMEFSSSHHTTIDLRQPPSQEHTPTHPLLVRQPAAIPAMPAAPSHRTQRSHTRPWFKPRSSFSPPELVDAGVWASQRSRPSRGYCPRLTQRMPRPSPSPTGCRPSFTSTEAGEGGTKTCGLSVYIVASTPLHVAS